MVIVMFRRAGERNIKTSKYQFWQQHNKSIELWSDKVINQNIDYTHNNPIESGFVTNAIDCKYSSTRNHQDDPTVLEIDCNGLLG